MASSALALRFKFPIGRDLPAPPKKSPLDFLDSLVVRISCRRGQVVCQPGQLASSWYRVVSAAAEKCAMQADGRPQIMDLLLPGDFFGFNWQKNDQHLVEALVDGTGI